MENIKGIHPIRNSITHPPNRETGYFLPIFKGKLKYFLFSLASSFFLKWKSVLSVLCFARTKDRFHRNYILEIKQNLFLLSIPFLYCQQNLEKKAKEKKTKNKKTSAPKKNILLGFFFCITLSSQFRRFMKKNFIIIW